MLFPYDENEGTGYVCDCCHNNIGYDEDFAKFDDSARIICRDCFYSVQVPFSNLVEAIGGEVCNIDYYEG